MKNEYYGFEIKKLPNSYTIFLKDSWNKDNLKENIKNIKALSIPSNTNICLDFQNLQTCDSISIIYLISFIKTFKEENVKIENLNKFEKFYNLYNLYYCDDKEFKPENKSNFSIEKLGKFGYYIYDSIMDFIYFIGKLFYFFIYSILNPKKIRFKAMLQHIETSAINALFIIMITSFLVGLVIAYQGSVQLEKFGANIFIVEMVSITMFREIAPLITAIVIAGRSASSYTAEIGAMKITEEIDAMKTMGFEPTIYLTLPRIFALFISLPLMVFFADIIGIIAGMVVAHLDLDITYPEFLHRMYTEVPLKHLLIGIGKSMFFGMAIAIIGCYRGFQVKNTTTSIGTYTTISVVNAIFIVIALNAIFSVILTEAGI